MSKTFRFIVLLVAVVAVFIGGCKKKSELQHGSGQRAGAREVDEQNRNLLQQVVLAAEELERHPDPSYLPGAMGRLNSWLDKRQPLKGYTPDPELVELSRKNLELASLLQNSQKIVEQFSTPAGENSSPLTAESGMMLLKNMEQIAPLCREIYQTIESPVYPEVAKLVDGFAEKLRKSQEYQFGDRISMFRSAIAQSEIPSWAGFSRLVEAFNEYGQLLDPAIRTFQRLDADNLKQAVWLRNIAHWAREKSQDDLGVVKSLFDWTVKNIILTEKDAKGAIESPPLSPWQTLLLSHGTPLERAVVFMELLRQMRLDAFLLEPKEPKTDFPVIVGVRIEDSIYLFLPELGVPIPGAGGPKLAGGLTFPTVATLKQLRENDALLRQLDISEEEKFPLTSGDLTDMVALVPISPFSLSERMQMIEQEFSGNIFTVLATSWSAQQERLNALGELQGVKPLWNEFEPLLFQIVFPNESALLTLPYLYEMKEGGSLELGVKERKEEEMTDAGTVRKSPLRNSEAMQSPLWMGKLLYFKGDFTGDRGAAHWLVQGRVSDRLLKQDTADIEEKVNQFLAEMVRDYQTRGEPLTKENIQEIGRELVLAERQNLMAKKYLKLAGRYYLALVSMAAGNDQTARSHLSDITLLEDLGGYWRDGTLYLLARLDEKNGDYAKATSLYRSMNGPLQYGNRLRGTWIASRSDR